MKNAEKTEKIQGKQTFRDQSNDEFEKNGVNANVKDKSQQLQGKQTFRDQSNDDFEKNRVNRYLKNAEKTEQIHSNKINNIQPKLLNNQNFIIGGGLSDDDEEFTKNIEKGMQRQKDPSKSKSPLKALEMDMDFDDNNNKRVSNVLVKNQLNKNSNQNDKNINTTNINSNIKVLQYNLNENNNISNNISKEKKEMINFNINNGLNNENFSNQYQINNNKNMQTQQISNSKHQISKNNDQDKKEIIYSQKLDANNRNQTSINNNFVNNNGYDENHKELNRNLEQKQKLFNQNNRDNINNQDINNINNPQQKLQIPGQINRSNNNLILNQNQQITNQNTILNIQNQKHQLSINNQRTKDPSPIPKQNPQMQIQQVSNNLNNKQNVNLDNNEKKINKVKFDEKDEIIAHNEKRTNRMTDEKNNATDKPGVISFRNRSGSKDGSKKGENVKEKWLDLNSEWEFQQMGTTKDSKNAKNITTVPIYVSSLLPNHGDSNQKIRSIKVDAPMFDDPSLHIKKSSNTKTLKIENLSLGPKLAEEEAIKLEEMKKEENLKYEKFSQKKQRLEQEKKNLVAQQKNNQVVKKKTIGNDEIIMDEKDKVFQAKQNVVKNGEKYNIEKKIYTGGESNFTFQITVPQKLAAPKYEDLNEQDERVRILKDKFEKKAIEKSIYTGPDINAIKVNENISKSVIKDDTQGMLSGGENMQLNIGGSNKLIIQGGENNMRLNGVGSNKLINQGTKIKSKEDTQGMLILSGGENNMQLNVGGSNKLVMQGTKNIENGKMIISNYEQSTRLIMDEQHMFVHKTFKSDQITFVSNDYHQPIDKSVDIKQFEIERSMKKEEPKQTPKYIEIKKDLIKTEIKRIVEVREVIQNDAAGEVLNLGGGENLKLSETKIIDNTNQKKTMEVESKLPGVKSTNLVEESFFSNNQQNFEEENRMNISKVSRLSKLDIDEVWDNSMIENNDHDLFNNSIEFKFK